ncbi:MAG TPA: NUDIX hydrolase [Stellaceae bacterium]|jgi:8-oxo-dGTP pyrophosphatase MutT (NUDIX family)|nr:NUDIX hydrolase [Stellaceae bacterium]
MPSAKSVTCGVIVTDGRRMLLGHATRSPRWDIPKGIADPGEGFAAAACRELQEETGLVAREDELVPLGVRPYRSGKDLALFVWRPPAMPDPKSLVCVSCFTWRGSDLPEFDRFGLFDKDEAVARVGKAMAAILAGIPLDERSGASVSPGGRAKDRESAN